MAIDDIVRRIEEDAANEAASIVAEAEQEAAQLRDEAKAKADREAVEMLAREAARAERDAETLVANARLAARDAMLGERLRLASDVLSQAEAAILALPDDEYAAFIARGVASSARGGEEVLIGGADERRLRERLPRALAESGAPALSVSGTAEDPERGVALRGDRVQLEVSASAALKERREELLALADSVLFETEA